MFFMFFMNYNSTYGHVLNLLDLVYLSRFDLKTLGPFDKDSLDRNSAN